MGPNIRRLRYPRPKKHTCAILYRRKLLSRDWLVQLLPGIALNNLKKESKKIENFMDLSLIILMANFTLQMLLPYYM